MTSLAIALPIRNLILFACDEAFQRKPHKPCFPSLENRCLFSLMVCSFPLQLQKTEAAKKPFLVQECIKRT